MVLSPTLIQTGYLIAFSGAAIACLWGVAATRSIHDPDTRRGLAGLLGTAGLWAAATVAYLLAPTGWLATGAHFVGLVAGFATVGAWLYFCSAYTGRSLHREPRIRRVAVGVFLAVVAVKLTNPLHGLYFSTRVVETPFPHVAIEYGVAHWLAMGTAYGLALVGYFMLLELFVHVETDTRPLYLLVALTGAPVVLDVLGVTTDVLLAIPHESLGVAVFAVGVLAVYRGQFRSVQLAGRGTAPALVLTADDRVRDFGGGVADLFPSLSAADVGAQLITVLPAVAEGLAAEPPILAVTEDGERTYYRLTEEPLGAGPTGRVIRFVDVTDRERYRRKLERQNDRLEEFVSIVSHDLRSPLSVASGQLALARADREDDEHLERVDSAVQRMDELIEDLRDLARQGEPIDETEPVALGAVAEESWESVDTGAATLRVDGDGEFRADRGRLKQLFENLFRNAIEHGGRPDITVAVGLLADEEGFFVADDGEGIPPEEREEVFASGFTTSEDGTGFGLAIVEQIAKAHGWRVAVEESDAGGARFEFRTV